MRAPGPWWVAFVCGMASYIDAAAIAGFSSSVVILERAGALTPLEVGLGSAVLTLGIAVGALLGGRLGDRYGRRPVFLTTMAMIVAASALLILTTSVAMLLPAAVLLGLGIGADLPVSLATISEAADDRNRGRLLVFSNLLWIGGIAGNLVLVSLIGDEGLTAVRAVFLHIGIVATAVLLARLTIPESPVWRLARSERAAGVTTVRAQRAQVRSLLRAPYRSPFVALIVFYAATNLLANTNNQFGPYVLVNFGGLSVAEASRLLLFSVPLMVIGFLWFMRIAPGGVNLTYFRIGAVCGVGSPLVLAAFGVTPVTYVVALVLGAVAGVFAFEAVMKIWTQQSFPTLLRGTAQGSIIAVARLTAAVFAALTPLLLQSGTTVLFALVTVFVVVGVTAALRVFGDRSRVSEFDREGLLEPDVELR